MGNSVGNCNIILRRKMRNVLSQTRPCHLSVSVNPLAWPTVLVVSYFEYDFESELQNGRHQLFRPTQNKFILRSKVVVNGSTNRRASKHDVIATPLLSTNGKRCVWWRHAHTPLSCLTKTTQSVSVRTWMRGNVIVALSAFVSRSLGDNFENGNKGDN